MDANTNIVKESIGDYSNKLKKNIRPRQKFFNASSVTCESKRHNFLQEHFDYYRNKYYKDGFLIKCLKLKSLVIEEVVPKIEEIRIFETATNNKKQANEENGLIDNIMNSMQDIGYSKKQAFIKGDKVKLIKGNMNNITGTVLSHQNGIVQIIPDIKGLY